MAKINKAWPTKKENILKKFYKRIDILFNFRTHWSWNGDSIEDIVQQ